MFSNNQDGFMISRLQARAYVVTVTKGIKESYEQITKDLTLT